MMTIKSSHYVTPHIIGKYVHVLISIFLILHLSPALFAANITATLDTADGTSSFSFLDSAASEIAAIDSDGNLQVRGGLRLDSGGTECATAEMLIVDGKIGVGTDYPTEDIETAGDIRVGAANTEGRIYLSSMNAGLEGGHLQFESPDTHPDLHIDSYNGDWRFFRADTDADITPVRYINYQAGGSMRFCINYDETTTLPFEVHDSKSSTPPNYEGGTVAGFVKNDDATNWARISIVGGNTGAAVIDFGDVNDADVGQIRYDNSGNDMYVQVGGATKFLLQSSVTRSYNRTYFHEGLEVDYETTSWDSYGIKFWRGDNTNPRQYYCYLDLTPANGLRVIGNGEVQWAYVNSTSGWQAGCSRDLKNTINELEVDDFSKIYDELGKTSLYEYERNDVPGVREVGVIAEVAPSLITGTDGKSISYTRWLGWLTAVNKYQKQLIEELENNNNALNERVRDLETRILELENKMR